MEFAESMAEASDRTITLPDGRRLGYADLGDPEGVPLIFCHGTPGSRKMLVEGESLAGIPGLRLILPDRPGYGLSDPQPDRTLLNWATDVEFLADRLHLDRFAIGGVSGGGPHALACAYALPKRLIATLILVSPSPAGFRGATRGMALGNRLGIWLYRWAPGMLRRMTTLQRASFAKDPGGFVKAVGRQMGAPDQRILKDPEVQEAFIRDLREAFRQDVDASYEDGRLGLMAKTWDFPLNAIKTHVHLWHGAEDTLVSRGMAEVLAREIPHNTARIVPDAAHLLLDTPEVVEEMQAALGL